MGGTMRSTLPQGALRWVFLSILILLLFGLVGATSTLAGAQTSTDITVPDGQGALANDTLDTAENVPIDDTTKRCMRCHRDNHPGIVEQYTASTHFEAGIGCMDCHAADDDQPTAEKHFDTVISKVVTPKDCRTCHGTETEQFHDSLHDEAGMFSAKAISNVDAESESMPKGWNEHTLTHYSRVSAEAGCQECHGAELRVVNDNDPTAPEEDVKVQGYPNHGIGRFNPDGSIGTCAACHTQHEFSLEQARKPSACTECHMGPDHPQKEIYEESKHSTMWHHNLEGFDLDAEQLTTEDVTAPSCAVCHMSGLGEATQTHDVSARLKWEAEPVYSYPTSREYETGEEPYEVPDEVARRYEMQYGLENGTLSEVPTGAPDPFAILQTYRPDLYREYVIENDEQYPQIEEGDDPTRWDAFAGESQIAAETKRGRMTQVCTECHTETWVENEFEKRDGVIHHYNAIYQAAGEKYYEPIKDEAPKAGPYDRSWVDNIYYEMWHHDGRRWRMGALMKGQDYSHWHGSYDVLKGILELAHAKAMIENGSAAASPDVAPGTEDEMTETTVETTTTAEADAAVDEDVEASASGSSSDEATTPPPTESGRARLPAGLTPLDAGIAAGVVVLGLAAIGLGRRP